MKACGTSYLFNSKKLRRNWKNCNFDKKTFFYATNFMSIFSQNFEYLWEYSTELHKFSLQWRLIILASNGCKNLEEKINKKFQFWPKIIFAVTKIMLKISQSIDYLGEYLTDFNKRGLEWELMVPATYLM